MESLEEILKVVGGIIFAAIYLFGNQIFKSKDEDAPRRPTLPRQSGSEEDEAADRQRQIQEAIRRKILERRQAAGGEAPASSQPVAQHQQGRKEVVERHKQTHQRAPHVEPTHQEPETDGRFSWDASDNVYEQQMQERLQQIEATKRRAEALKRQAGGALSPASETTERRQSTRRGALRSGPVRSVLRDPAAARTAIIYSEVLGKPVSMRATGSGVG
jgi:hypothetical protein